MINEKPLLLVGHGKMGSSLLRLWSERCPAPISIVDPHGEETPSSKGNLTFYKTAEDLPASFEPEVIVLAIKPQQMEQVLPAYKRYEKAVYLSIAAGQTLTRLAEHLGGSPRAIVRTMPNLPASLGRGVTAAIANPHVTEAQKKRCQTLLEATGDLVWIEQEQQMDAITALSGNGPAYLFAMIESLAAAGERLGLAPDLAAHLARQTMIGAGALLEQSPESVTTLRQAVTSPGGTTAAALNHLLAPGGLPDLFSKALRAATDRSRELAT